MGGIAELVLHSGNDFITYNNKYNGTPISRELISQDFNKNDYCVIARNGDIVDDIYLCLITTDEFFNDPYNLIDKVQLISQGDILEEFSGNSMYISSIINKSQDVFCNKNKIYFKLNFALKEIHLIRMQFYDIKVHVKINESYKNLVLEKYLNVNYLFLNHLNRQNLAQKKICEFQVDSIQETQFNFKKGEKIKIDVPEGLLRELIIYVKRKDNTTQNSILSNIKLQIFGTNKESVEIEYYQSVTSHQYYNCKTPDNMYIIPIDNTPLEKYPSATLNTFKGDASLILDIKENINIEDYQIILFSRNCEIISSSYGMLGKFNFKTEIKSSTTDIKTDIDSKKRTFINYITLGMF